MRISRTGWLVGLICWLPLVACGQQESPRVAGGVFASAGLEDLDLTATAGGYVEAARFQFRPGGEVREETRTGQEKVLLGGPRVSYAVFGRDVYAMALFGRGQRLNEAGTKEVSGLSSEVGIGLEKNLGPLVRWRMVEFSAQFFSGSRVLRRWLCRLDLCFTFTRESCVGLRGIGADSLLCGG